MRSVLDKKLKDVHIKLLRMSSLVEESINLAMKALEEQDLSLAEKIIKEDAVINAHELEIENMCITIIATQNPVGSDLRRIFTIMKIVTDLERIGDHSVNIARVVLNLGHYKLIKPLIDLPKMSIEVQKMLSDSIQAYVDESPELAETAAQMDESVDLKYANVYKELLRFIKTNSEDEDQIIGLLLVGRYLERIADHSTNICERVIYMITGETAKF